MSSARSGSWRQSASSLTVGIGAVERWTLHLTDLLIQDLEQRGHEIASNRCPEHRSAIVSFRVPGKKVLRSKYGNL